MVSIAAIGCTSRSSKYFEVGITSHQIPSKWKKPLHHPSISNIDHVAPFTTYSRFFICSVHSEKNIFQTKSEDLFRKIRFCFIVSDIDLNDVHP